MPYGVLGSQADQTVKNFGVFSVNDVADLEKQGKFGGSLEFISEQTVSSVASLDFLDIKQDAYKFHQMQIINYEVDTDNTILTARLYESGVLESASVYKYGVQRGLADNNFNEDRSTGSNYGIALNTSGVDSGTGGSLNGYINFLNLGDSTKYSQATFNWVYMHYTGILGMNFGGGSLIQASEVDGIRIGNNAGNFSCTARLYGVKDRI